MGEEKQVKLGPRDLAIVWGTALGQLSQLWRAGIKAMMEAGDAEADIHGDLSAWILVKADCGGAQNLRPGPMVGETFGSALPDGAVKLLDPQPPPAPSPPSAAPPGFMWVYCTVDETPRVRGDLHRGTVIDKQGNVVGEIALDAGS